MTGTMKNVNTKCLAMFCEVIQVWSAKPFLSGRILCNTASLYTYTEVTFHPKKQTSLYSKAALTFYSSMTLGL